MRRNVRVVSSLIAIIVAAALASAVTAASAQPPKTKSEDLLHQRATVNAAKSLTEKELSDLRGL